MEFIGKNMKNMSNDIYIDYKPKKISGKWFISALYQPG